MTTSASNQSVADRTDPRSTQYLSSFQRSGGEAAVAAVLADLSELTPEEKAVHMRSHVPTEVLRDQSASVLRGFLTSDERVMLSLEEAKAGNIDRILLLEAAQVVGELKLGSGARKDFWNLAAKYVEFRGFLWDLAPPTIRKLVRRPNATGLAPDMGSSAPNGRGRPTLGLMGRTTGPVPSTRPSAFDDWQQLMPQWGQKLKDQPIATVISDAREAAEGFSNSEARSKHIRELPPELLLHEDARKLRLMLTGEHKRITYLALATQEIASDAQLEEFINMLTNLVDLKEAVDTWLAAIDSSPHAQRLSRKTPKRIKTELYKRQHASFVRALKAVAPYNPPEYTSIMPSDLYPSLGESDRMLAEKWADAKEKNKDFETAKMLSARGAEHAAARFYKGLGYTVIDTAIRQVTDFRNEDWRTHDLYIQGYGPVDVKNARTAVNSKEGYSEHAVPSFKQDRNSDDVIVVGVRSPYLKAEEFENPDEIPPHRNIAIQVLGECRRKQLEELRKEFLSPMLHDITLKRRTRNGEKLEETEFLPPWVFNFPECYYKQAEIVSYRTSVAQVLDQDLPEWHALPHLDANPLPLYLQKKELPQTWRPHMPEWKVALAERIIDKALTSLPHLFLTLLTDFLMALRLDRAEYAPNQYQQLLYPCTTTSWRDEAKWHSMPLGIADPLKSIASLIKTLELLWQNREKSRLTEFTRFQFTSVGLLRGTREGEAELTTILAYCGGRTSQKAPCGNSPLVLGMHESCPECRYLACEKCGYCSPTCSQCAPRQERTEREAATRRQPHFKWRR